METPPPPPPPNYATVSTPLDIGRCLNESLAVYHKSGVILLLAGIVFALGMAPLFIPHLGWVIGWFLAPIAWLIVSSAYIQQVREREAELADILSPRGFPVQPNPATT